MENCRARFSLIRASFPGALAALALALLVSTAMTGCSKPRNVEMLRITKIGLSPAYSSPASPAVQFDIAIKAGWHINAHEVDDPFVVPTSLSVSVTPGSAGSTSYPPATRTLEVSGMKLKVYDGKFSIIVPLSLTPGAAPGSVAVSGVLDYQPCNELQCLEPRHTKFKTSVKILP
jgi:hypothetical protein